jgi:hypothetical protein
MAGNGRAWLEFFSKRLGEENVNPMSEMALSIFNATHTLFPNLLKGLSI